uniref:Uncharacterized protein n=1 Tax=uncultured prokaryote TaxID=198431 RepID=A0A0H5Q3N8_9ZZZZ|nr:hypothetical protein [uncultured prokaryote]
MPFNTPFLRLVIQGTLPGPETFAMNITLAPVIPPNISGDVPDDVPGGVIDAVNRYWASAKVGGNCEVTTLKLNLISVDGRYVNDDTVQYDYSTPLEGSGTAKYPNQVALKITTRTAKKRGRAHAGGWFLPSPSYVLSATLDLISAADALSAATAAQEFVEDLNAALPGWQVAVVSKVGTGATQPVTYLSVGRVLDTMRSRRTSVDEQYVDSPLVTGL